jgi:hypothetical protein
MSDNRNCGCSTISGVSCGAKNCKYHTTEDKCSASSIKVENTSAMKKAETWCGTFCSN